MSDPSGYFARVQSDLAHFLVAERAAIARAAARVAPLDAASPEAEALRRFRSFALLALAQGAAEPALEGVRVPVERAARAIDAWVEAVGSVAGPGGVRVAAPLTELRARFVAALAASAPARSESAAPVKSARRAVAAAIDRIADVFLAADCASAALVDANPAACALVGLGRSELLARDLYSLAPAAERSAWSLLLEAIAEGSEPRSARCALRDASGAAALLDVRATRFAPRGRTLALLVCRPPR